MKKTGLFPALAALLLLAVSCEKDNYEAPNASIHGSFIDEETGELVEQDIYNGTVIEYIEDGYTTIETMIVKNDGTYRNNLMFAADYEITPKRGNFEPLDPQKVRVEGDTRLDVRGKPYIRIEDAVIFKNGDVVKASFKLTQTGFDKVKTLGLFVFREPSVGYQMNTVKVEVPVGERFREPQYFTINLNLPSNADKLKKGESYFFRVGALIDVPEAKYNYAKAVRLTL